jgi:hypothetical protein
MAMPPLRFSRNMTTLRDGERLVLVNCVRLHEAGLASLDALGTVTDPIRLAVDRRGSFPHARGEYLADPPASDTRRRASFTPTAKQ